VHDRWEYTIPANTAEADAIKIECPISMGTLTRLSVYFPPGNYDLGRCRVRLGEKPIAPRSPSNYLTSNGHMIVLEDMEELISENRSVLVWELWNLDETWPHTPWMTAEWYGHDEPYAKTTTRLISEFISVIKNLIGV